MTVHWITDERVERVARDLYLNNPIPVDAGHHLEWDEIDDDSREQHLLDAATALRSPDVQALLARIAELETAASALVMASRTEVNAPDEFQYDSRTESIVPDDKLGMLAELVP